MMSQLLVVWLCLLLGSAVVNAVEVWESPRDEVDPLKWKLVARRDDLVDVHRLNHAPLPFIDEVLIPGSTWYRVTSAGQIEKLTDQPLPWQFRHGHYGTSSHYGLVAWNGQGQVFRVIVDPNESQLADVAAQNPHVPSAELPRHIVAAEFLRSRGATVDAVWGESPEKIHSLMEPGTGSGYRPKWHPFVFLGPEWNGSAADLRRIGDLHGVMGQYAVKAKLSNDDLREIGQLTNLEALMLVETQATDAELKHLHGLKRLNFLRLEGTLNGREFTDASLVHLAALPSLTHLVVYGSGFTDAGLAYWPRLGQLKSLWLGDTAMTRDGRVRLREQFSKTTQIFDQLFPRSGSQ